MSNDEEFITVTVPLPPDFVWDAEAEAFIRAKLAEALYESLPPWMKDYVDSLEGEA